MHSERRLGSGSTGVSTASPESGVGWHSRGYLPHFDQPGLVQFITFRLADALPANKLHELREDPRGLDGARARQRLESLLDSGFGSCYLREAGLARLVEGALFHSDGMQYRLLAWAVMPNHVHVLIETLPGSSLSAVVQSWKSFTAHAANKRIGRTGRFWQPEYFDRAIRDERHFGNAVNYIHETPVKAGLVGEAGDWPFSSAARERERAAEAEASEHRAW